MDSPFARGRDARQRALGKPPDDCYARARRGSALEILIGKGTAPRLAARRLRETGHRVVSIGKLHFRATSDDNDFSEEVLPMHVIEGKGDLMGLVREDLPRRGGSWKIAELAGPGESSYTFYNRDIAARADLAARGSGQVR